MTECVAAHGCITCGDVADEMVVLRIDAELGTALCADEHGEQSEVFTALVDGVAPGDTLLVHAGTALTRVEGAAA